MPEHNHFTYRGAKTREISFPLGGIGTGSIGLSGSGRLVDWEIFNHPNKCSVNGFSHFAIKAERAGQVIDARVLHSDLHPPYNGSLNGPTYNAYGFGPQRELLSGFPHFRSVAFTGTFPTARLDFEDDRFPGQVNLLAFNPLIPLNEFDSGIPAAFFEINVINTTSEALDYLLSGTLSNPLPATQLHSLYEEEGRCYLHLRSTAEESGDLTLAVESPEGVISSQAYWFRGAWFDNLEVYWHDLNQPGGLKPRSYPPEAAGDRNSGSLACRFTLDPGESRSVRFLIAWNFPYMENTWNEQASHAAQEKGLPLRWKNYYATRFENSFFSAQYSLDSWERLYHQTNLFQQALYGSTLDPIVIEAVAANLSVLKSPTVLRLEDGTFYGFEGCHPSAGCCEGSCTHVWNYAQAAPFLFPALERSMRSIDFTFNQREDGAMRFRLPLPAGLTAEDFWRFHPCADGQLGNVLKAYADWKISGDGEWLRRHWPAIKKAVEFAWAPTNEYRWDPEQSGVLSGRLHHTLDMELFSPSSWLNGFYLAALESGAQMAESMGEPDTAALYRQIYHRGREYTDRELFNGEFYLQRVNLADRSLPESFGVSDTYWDAEHGEIKYQIGEGCEIDQLLAQWHANLYGLGELFDPQQARTALRSLFRYNFRRPLRDDYNPCRVFALNDEAGLVMCAWPEHVRKPVIPVPYSQEVMTGFEYAAAGLMIQSGMVEEGLEVVRAIRARYDGEKRNPWNEIECGSNYARSMASYGLLLAFSGFSFDLTRKYIGFEPMGEPGAPFNCFWSLDCGWGIYRQSLEQVSLEVLYGELEVQRLRLPAAAGTTTVSLDGNSLAFDWLQDELVLRSPARIRAGSMIQIG